jgi:hypothetical protein
VPFTKPAPVYEGVRVQVVQVKPMTAKAILPGEISGPAVEVDVRITNDTSRSLALDNVVVNVQDAQGTPSNLMSAPPAKPFSGAAAAHSSADAVYVFSLPAAHRNPISVSVSYTAAAPVVVFSGAVS